MPPQAAPATFCSESLMFADVPATLRLPSFMPSHSRALGGSEIIVQNKN